MQDAITRILIIFPPYDSFYDFSRGFCFREVFAKHRHTSISAPIRSVNLHSIRKNLGLWKNLLEYLPSIRDFCIRAPDCNECPEDPVSIWRILMMILRTMRNKGLEMIWSHLRIMWVLVILQIQKFLKIMTLLNLWCKFVTINLRILIGSWGSWRCSR